MKGRNWEVYPPTLDAVSRELKLRHPVVVDWQDSLGRQSGSPILGRHAFVTSESRARVALQARSLPPTPGTHHWIQMVEGFGSLAECLACLLHELRHAYQTERDSNHTIKANLADLIVGYSCSPYEADADRWAQGAVGRFPDLVRRVTA